MHTTPHSHIIISIYIFKYYKVSRRGRMQKQLLTVNLLTPCPLCQRILTHSFFLQNSPFLGTEVIVFFLGIHRLPDRNPCHYLLFFSGEISHFCLLPINKSAAFYLLTINKSNISSIIKALIALYDALGGDKGMDVLRVVGYLLCQCRLARCQGWLQERIAIARQYNLGGRDRNCT